MCIQAPTITRKPYKDPSLGKSGLWIRCPVSQWCIIVSCKHYMKSRKLCAGSSQGSIKDSRVCHNWRLARGGGGGYVPHQPCREVHEPFRIGEAPFICHYAAARLTVLAALSSCFQIIACRLCASIAVPRDCKHSGGKSASANFGVRLGVSFRRMTQQH